MLLSALLETTEPSAIALSAGSGDPDVLRVVHDSRQVRPGDLFCCIPGQSSDGHEHATEAVAAGAVAVLAERVLDVDVPLLVVNSIRILMPLLATEVAGRPSEKLEVIGITGTNGKTSVTHLLGGVFEYAGRKPAIIGTLAGGLTTPEAPDLQGQLASLVSEGVGAVVMEVSSHALDQYRVDGTHFSTAAFTNLSRDHLDYHQTMESYAAAKGRLFTPVFTDRAVIVVDSRIGARLAKSASRMGLEVVEVSVSGIDREVQVDQVAFRWRNLDVHVPVGGDFTVANSVVAAELAYLAGVAPLAIVDGLARISGIPGRFEQVEVQDGPTVIVDYAHSPDSLTALLASVRSIAAGGRVISVFGCGGERDTGKRPEMGRAAEEGADLVVLTSDNPRGEPPEGVIADILEGMAGRPEEVVVDRRQAIGAALGMAHSEDVVVISGKGHEKFQEVDGQQLPFDDRIVVREEAKNLADGHARDAGIET